MRFKSFYLLEASKEYSIAKVMADKLIKLMSEIEYSAHKDPKYLKKYKYSNSGMFEVPLKDFINKEFPKDSVFSHLKDGKLYLEYGYMDNSPTPFLWAITTKDGKTSRNKAGAYFEPSKGFLGIHIPFIDPKTDLPYKGFNSHWKTLLIHEFTHYIQDSKERFKEGSSTLSTEDWHKDKHEQEAYLHELYSLFQKWLSTEIEELKYLRTSDKYHEADLPKYIKKNNFLAKLFSSEEMFERKYPIGEIFLDNDKQKKRINYIAGNLKELYKKFIHDTYVELKKEFKNTLPSKELKYTKEEFMFVEYINKYLIEMAKPSSKIQSIEYYHGVPTEEVALHVVENGITPRNKSRHIKGMAPVKGMVYLSPSKQYASNYARGINFEDMSEQYGYIFVVDGTALVDIFPDEDSLAKVMSNYILRLPKYKDSGYVTKAMSDDVTKICETLVSQLEHAEYQHLLTRSYKYFPKIGKKLLKLLNPSDILAFVEDGSDLFNKGSVIPKKVIVIDKHKLKNGLSQAIVVTLPIDKLKGYLNEI
jgi:hypothetical protein